VFDSVYDILFVWLTTLVVVGIALRSALNRAKSIGFVRFIRSERGAAYAIPYVMTSAVAAFMMALLVQSTFILMAKIGTMYAAHSACRSFIAWQPVGHDVDLAPWATIELGLIGVEANENIPEIIVGGGSVETRIRPGFDIPTLHAKRAATMAMVPFASSYPQHLDELFPAFPLVAGRGDNFGPASATGALVYIDRWFYEKAYRRILDDSISENQGFVSDFIREPDAAAAQNYIYNKYKYAAAATAVSTPDDMVPWNGDVEIKVTYRMPFHIAATAPILAGRQWWAYRFFGIGGDSYYRDIETSIVLPSEAGKTEDGKIGIPYQPSLLLEALNE